MLYDPETNGGLRWFERYSVVISIALGIATFYLIAYIVALLLRSNGESAAYEMLFLGPVIAGLSIGMVFVYHRLLNIKRVYSKYNDASTGLHQKESTPKRNFISSPVLAFLGIAIGVVSIVTAFVSARFIDEILRGVLYVNFGSLSEGRSIILMFLYPGIYIFLLIMFPIVTTSRKPLSKIVAYTALMFLLSSVVVPVLLSILGRLM